MFEVKPCLIYIIQMIVSYFPDYNASIENKAQDHDTDVCECGRYCRFSVFSRPKSNPRHQDVWIGDQIGNQDVDILVEHITIPEIYSCLCMFCVSTLGHRIGINFVNYSIDSIKYMMFSQVCD